jgi:hypothetical protein
VVVWLDRRSLEELEVIIEYRHGRKSRSAVVREAVDWLLTKEAGWLLRRRRQDELREREAQLDAEAQLRSAEERAMLNWRATIDHALEIARDRGD